jgi:hypothetical protein
MKTVTLEIYEYSELSQDAKDRAYQKWVDGREYFWDDDSRRSIEWLKEKIWWGKLRDWEYSQDGYRFSVYPVEIREWEEELTGYRLYKWVMNNTEMIQLKYLTHKSHTPRYSKFQTQLNSDGYWLSAVGMEVLNSWRPSPDDTLEDYLNEIYEKVFQALRDDCEHSFSREYFEEHDAHQVDYYKNGDVF